MAAEVPTNPRKITDPVQANTARISEAQLLGCSFHQLLVSRLPLQCFNCQALRVLSVFRDYTPDGKESYNRLVAFHRNMKASPV